MKFGLVDILWHFCQCLSFQHLNTWSQVRQVRLLRSRCNYIFLADQQLFEMVDIRDMRNYLSDHFTLHVCLLQ